MNIDQVLETIEPAWTAWTSLFAGVPEYPLAVSVYLGGSALALLLWVRVARALPRPLGGMSWVLLLAILLTPTVTPGINAQLAPAVVGLGLAVVSKQYDQIIPHLLPMLAVIGVGFLVGFLLERLQVAAAPRVSPPVDQTGVPPSSPPPHS